MEKIGKPGILGKVEEIRRARIISQLLIYEKQEHVGSRGTRKLETLEKLDSFQNLERFRN